MNEPLVARLRGARSLVVLEARRSQQKATPPNAGARDRALRLRCRPPCRSIRGPHADVAVAIAPDARTVARAHQVAPLVISAGGRARGSEPATLGLGRDGAIWTPGWTLGSEGLWEPTDAASRPDRECELLLIAPDAGCLRQMLLTAADRRLPVTAGVAGLKSVAGRQGLAAAVRGFGATTTLVVLDRAVDLRTLVELRGAENLVLLLIGDARRIATGSAAVDGLEAVQVLGELGLAAFQCSVRALEAARLVAGGVRPRTGTVMAIAETADTAPLLRQRLEVHGLQLAAPARRTQLEVRKRVIVGDLRAARAAAKLVREGAADALISDALLRGRDATAQSRPGARDSDHGASWRPDGDTLAALAALLGLPVHGPTGRPPSAPRPPAARRTRGGPGPLQLLASCGIAVAPRRAVTSATGAGRAADELGYPVLVRADGRALDDHGRWGGEVEGVPNAPRARQAFRDVLFASREHDPEARVSSVSVIRDRDYRLRLDCQLLSFGGLALLRAAPAARRPKLTVAQPVVVALPSAARRARSAAERLLRCASEPTNRPALARRALERWLRHLGALPQLTAGRDAQIELAAGLTVASGAEEPSTVEVIWARYCS